MLSRRQLAAIAILLAALSANGAEARAQEPSVRLLPVTSQGFRMRVSPDGSLAAIFTDPNLLDNKVEATALPIRLIDLASGQTRASLDGFTDYAADVAFTPDGSRLAAFHGNGVLDIWEVASPNAGPLRSFQTTLLGASQIEFLPDGRTLIALIGGHPARFYLWDTDTGAATAILGPTFPSLGEFLDRYSAFPAVADVSYTTFAVSVDGRTLASATLSDEVSTWDIATAQPRQLRPASDQPGRLSIRQLRFSPDGSSLLYFDESDGQTHVWDLDARTEAAALAVGALPFTLSPDGTLLAWAERDGDGTSLKVVALAQPDAPRLVANVALRPVPGLTSLAFTPDGATIVAGGFFASDEQNAIAVVSVK